MKEKSLFLRSCPAVQIFGLDLLKFPAVGRKADLALPSIIYHLCQLEADLVQGMTIGQVQVCLTSGQVQVCLTSGQVQVCLTSTSMLDKWACTSMLDNFECVIDEA